MGQKDLLQKVPMENFSHSHAFLKASAEIITVLRFFNTTSLFLGHWLHSYQPSPSLMIQAKSKETQPLGSTT